MKSREYVLDESDPSLLPIERIRHAARAGTWPKLDQDVYLSEELHLYELRDRRRGPDHCYLDVPLENVVALSHRNFFGAGSWRAAALGLGGHRWGEAVFEYFDSPLLERTFPAEGSRYALRLMSVGGAVECDNGMHRLAAAMAWLGHRDQARSRLRMAHIAAYRIDPRVRGAIQSLTKEEAPLWMGLPTYASSVDVIASDIEAVFSRDDDRETIYAIRDSGLVPIQRQLSWLARLRSQRRVDISHRFTWHMLPPFVLACLLDDTWVSDQVDSAWRWST